MKIKSIIFTMLLLLALAACSGASESDTEAIGSESAGDIVPTPVTGPKVLPTRVGVGTAVTSALDILFVTQASLFNAVDLEKIAAELSQADVRIGLSLYGETGPVGAYDLTTEVGELTAVLNQPPTTIDQPITIANALAAGMQLPGWRENSSRLIFLMTDAAVPANDRTAFTGLALTAVSQNMQINPILLGGMDDPNWTELAETTNGRLSILANTDDPATLIIEAVEE